MGVFGFLFLVAAAAMVARDPEGFIIGFFKFIFWSVVGLFALLVFIFIHEASGLSWGAYLLLWLVGLSLILMRSEYRDRKKWEKRINMPMEQYEAELKKQHEKEMKKLDFY